jgi:hypothetical protein
MSGGVVQQNGLASQPVAFPRGLLQPPTQVIELVAREATRLTMSPEARKRITEDMTLQFFFEGVDVAYRRAPQGVEILAVGAEEIGTLVKQLTQEELLTIHIGQP